ncbi:MAG: transposase family protein [Proteobacteria bacterium]|nr:transposase family protein [Pseudomonadota bacterium]
MPKTNHILFLPGFSIKKTIQAMPLVMGATYTKNPDCPFCQNKKLRIKDTFYRQVRHESIGLRRAYFRFSDSKE